MTAELICKLQVIGNEVWFDGYHIAMISPFAPFSVIDDFKRQCEADEEEGIASVPAENETEDDPQPAETGPIDFGPWKGYRP